jgi:Ca2+-binding EF-hand superfamily protein
MTDEEIENFSKRSFALTDRNKDGVIDLNESPTSKYTKTRDGIVTETGYGKDVWMRSFDANGDGNVILSEYHEKLKELAYAKRNPSNVPLH